VTPAATSSLAYTGAQIGLLAGLAAVLLAAGTGLLLWSRRKVARR
jgi:LPXTG-motif cell wall-anchored protein